MTIFFRLETIKGFTLGGRIYFVSGKRGEKKTQVGKGRRGEKRLRIVWLYAKTYVFLTIMTCLLDEEGGESSFITI